MEKGERKRKERDKVREERERKGEVGRRGTR